MRIEQAEQALRGPLLPNPHKSKNDEVVNGGLAKAGLDMAVMASEIASKINRIFDDLGI